MSYFGSLEGDAQGPHQGVWPGLSPDGHSLVIVTNRARLPEGETESIVWSIDPGAIDKYLSTTNGSPPVARRLLKLAASVNGPIVDSEGGNSIRELRWLGANDLVLWSIDNTENRRLSTLDLRTQQLKRLSKDQEDVTAFDTASDEIIYAAREPIDPRKTWASAGTELPDAQFGRGKALVDLLYPHWKPNQRRLGPWHLWLVRGDSRRPVTDAHTGHPVSLSSAMGELFSLAPKAKFLVLQEGATIVSVNLATGEKKFPLQAPLSDLLAGSDDLVSAWSAKGEIAVAYQSPPRASHATDLGGARAGSPACAVLVLSPSNGAQTCAVAQSALGTKSVEGARLNSLSWSPDGAVVMGYVGDTSEGIPTTELWTCKPDQPCHLQSPERASGRGFELTVRQSLNDPPVVVAFRPGERSTQKVVFDPNPQLRSVNLGVAKVFKWHSGPHYLMSGLVLPPDYVEGRRYPLVIQGHGFDPDKFLSTGFYETGSSARALAARGIVVMQVAEPCLQLKLPCDSAQTPREPADNAAVYSTAIDALSSHGLIDPHKVGVLGFSRTGMYVMTALVQNPDQFAAAALDEAAYDLGSYYYEIDYRKNGPEQMAAEFGANPFGPGLKAWLDAAPFFHLERVRAPILFEAGSPAALLYSWGPYAALRAEHKPVDLLFFRDGRHVLVKPLERLASQETNVDWFDFWLNGREDPDPKKQDQYVRWRELKAEHEAEAQKPVAPWLTWTPTSATGQQPVRGDAH